VRRLAQAVPGGAVHSNRVDGVIAAPSAGATPDGGGGTSIRRSAVEGDRRREADVEFTRGSSPQVASTASESGTSSVPRRISNDRTRTLSSDAPASFPPSWRVPRGRC
jgi:hypothetical protein